LFSSKDMVQGSFICFLEFEELLDGTKSWDCLWNKTWITKSLHDSNDIFEFFFFEDISDLKIWSRPRSTSKSIWFNSFVFFWCCLLFFPRKSKQETMLNI
jgi:hypothetical protein